MPNHHRRPHPGQVVFHASAPPYQAQELPRSGVVTHASVSAPNRVAFIPTQHQGDLAAWTLQQQHDRAVYTHGYSHAGGREAKAEKRWYKNHHSGYDTPPMRLERCVREEAKFMGDSELQYAQRAHAAAITARLAEVQQAQEAKEKEFIAHRQTTVQDTTVNRLQFEAKYVANHQVVDEQTGERLWLTPATGWAYESDRRKQERKVLQRESHKKADLCRRSNRDAKMSEADVGASLLAAALGSS
mmetsp:Transcript_20528/g.59442  ORF Transcript_20528/g.59442 Transcript_20528/m.59442 type:complete len:244 (-) Transcript_20528:68-799(-)